MRTPESTRHGIAWNDVAWNDVAWNDVEWSAAPIGIADELV